MKLTCPTCQSPMEGRPCGGVQIDCCDQCNSIWFDEGELKRYAAANGLDHSLATRTKFELDSEVQSRHCPRCLRNSVRSGRHDGIAFGQCPRCSGLLLECKAITTLQERYQRRPLPAVDDGAASAPTPWSIPSDSAGSTGNSIADSALDMTVGRVELVFSFLDQVVFDIAL
jgi:Zn-finger nucleic acid-binding protein